MSLSVRAAVMVTAPLLVVGCCNAPQPGCQSTAVARPSWAPSLPQTVPNPLIPVVAQSVTAAPPPAGYLRLTAGMCQELAVRNCALANVLEEAAIEPGGHKKHRRTGAGEARMLVLLYAAEEARNRAAGDALDMYYKLVAAEAGAQVGRGAEADLKRFLQTARAAVASGTKEPPGPGQLEAQLAAVSADVIRAEGGAREANHGLKALLGLPQDSREQLWPDRPEVARVPDNVDEAVRVGLAYRPDLLLLRTLLGSGSPDAPESSREALATVSPLLAGPPSLIGKPEVGAEMYGTAPRARGRLNVRGARQLLTLASGRRRPSGRASGHRARGPGENACGPGRRVARAGRRPGEGGGGRARRRRGAGGRPGGAHGGDRERGDGGDQLSGGRRETAPGPGPPGPRGNGTLLRTAAAVRRPSERHPGQIVWTQPRCSSISRKNGRLISR